MLRLAQETIPSLSYPFTPDSGSGRRPIPTLPFRLLLAGVNLGIVLAGSSGSALARG